MKFSSDLSSSMTLDEMKLNPVEVPESIEELNNIVDKVEHNKLKNNKICSLSSNKITSRDSGIESLGKNSESESDNNGSYRNVSNDLDLIDEIDELPLPHILVTGPTNDNPNKNKNNKKCLVKNTTINNINCESESFAIHPRLINKYDGLKQTLYYIDENGSPKIREIYEHQGVGEKLKKHKKDAKSLERSQTSCYSFSKLRRKFKKSLSKLFFPINLLQVFMLRLFEMIYL